MELEYFNSRDAVPVWVSEELLPDGLRLIIQPTGITFRTLLRMSICGALVLLCWYLTGVIASNAHTALGLIPLAISFAIIAAGVEVFRMATRPTILEVSPDQVTLLRPSLLGKKRSWSAEKFRFDVSMGTPTLRGLMVAHLTIRRVLSEGIIGPRPKTEMKWLANRLNQALKAVSKRKLES